MTTHFRFIESNDKFSFETKKIHEFGHAEYSVTKSDNYDKAPEVLAREVRLDPFVVIDTNDNVARQIILDTGLSSSIIEMVLKCDIKSAYQIEKAKVDNTDLIYKHLIEPIAKCQVSAQAHLKQKDSGLKLNISTEGSSLHKYAIFKNWCIWLRTSLSDCPVMVETFDRTISSAISVDRGKSIDVVWPYEATDCDLNNKERLKEYSTKHQQLNPNTQWGLFKMSLDHKVGLQKVHQWVDLHLGSIIKLSIDGNILQQISPTGSQGHTGGFDMLVNLFHRFGKYEAIDLQQVEQKLQDFVFASVENTKSPQDVDNGILVFHKLHSLLLGQKPNYTERDGIRLLLNSLSDDKEYKQLVAFTNTHARSADGGYQTLQKLYEDIDMIHKQYHRTLNRNKRLHSTSNANGSNKKPKNFEPCENCGKKHLGGRDACTIKGGGNYKPKSSNNVNNKPNGNSNGKAKYHSNTHNNELSQSC